MRIAIPSEDGYVGGPGESREVEIYSVEDKVSKFIERYENPALKAEHTRGIFMIKSAMEKGCEILILGEAGAPAFNFTKGRIKIYNGKGMKTEEAINSFLNGNLKEMTGPTEHGNHHNYHENRKN
ncbi:NifB/NifX family molybdenum-iron cluster-binding protein [Cuniculiplasma sp. SKW4]|uniref:NifB/NifX family molybdenum-iron cluster-binding protein n=1 Tax=Cuniculiplasma sp. SKW4 TaxID=3400171 RepID=UPI003FD47ABE